MRLALIVFALLAAAPALHAQAADEARSAEHAVVAWPPCAALYLGLGVPCPPADAFAILLDEGASGSAAYARAASSLKRPAVVVEPCFGAEPMVGRVELPAPGVPLVVARQRPAVTWR